LLVGYVSIQICALLAPCRRPILNATTSPLFARRCIIICSCKPPQANLSRAMQWLNLSHGAWFNRRWQRSGPFVQGRFKAILHEPDNTALIINRYIHLNPVLVRALCGHEARSARKTHLKLAGQDQAANWSSASEALSSYRWSSSIERNRGTRGRFGISRRPRGDRKISEAIEDRSGAPAETQEGCQDVEN
jgi:hypothetical protein